MKLESYPDIILVIPPKQLLNALEDLERTPDHHKVELINRKIDWRSQDWMEKSPTNPRAVQR